GLGFLLMRLVLAKRGLLMEAGSTKATWAHKTFLPQRVRNLRATRVTAVLSGARPALGMSTVESFRSQMDGCTAANLRITSDLALFLAPMFLFVFGVTGLDRNKVLGFSKDVFRGWARVYGRGLCWMIGALAFWLARGGLREYLGVSL